MKGITKKNFKNVLRRCRLDSGLSQERAAELMDISRSYYSNMELGYKIPNIDMLFSIAAAFNIRPGDLITMLENEAFPDKEDKSRYPAIQIYSS